LVVNDGYVESLLDFVVINVKTADEAIQDLIDTTKEFNLQIGIESGLDAKLDAVLQALQDVSEENDVAAINSLEAFINMIEAQRGKELTETQADQLIRAAQAVIESLSA
jgi:hypothetical protein